MKIADTSFKFKSYFNQIQVLFKIHAYFGCNLKSVESYEGSYSKKYQDRVSCNFAYKLVCVDDKFTKPIVVFRGENAASEFLKQFLNSVSIVKK